MRLLLPLAAFAFSLSAAVGADNLRQETQRDTAGNRATVRTTDAAGIHTPHVIVDSGAIAPGANTSTTAATLTQGTKAVTTAGTPVLLVASQTLVESVEIFARKNPTTANTGNIYVGVGSTGGTNYRVVEPGSSLTISAPAGKKINLNTIYIDAATSADAVTYTAVN